MSKTGGFILNNWDQSSAGKWTDTGRGDVFKLEPSWQRQLRTLLFGILVSGLQTVRQIVTSMGKLVDLVHPGFMALAQMLWRGGGGACNCKLYFLALWALYFMWKFG